ncbi:MAG: cupin domain-containing protein [Flavobacteriaceae bacterium]
METTIKSLAAQPYDKLQIAKVTKTPALEILSISLEKGTEFPEHTSPTDAHLIVLEGSIDFHIDDEPLHLEKYQYYAFPKASPHWVKVRENSKFLIVR